jgi:membrane glycosyltransferase
MDAVSPITDRATLWRRAQRRRVFVTPRARRPARSCRLRKAPEGVGLLVSTLDGWLAAMQNQIAATREQRMASAERIRQHSAELAAVARSV